MLGKHIRQSPRPAVDVTVHRRLERQAVPFTELQHPLEAAFERIGID